MKKIKTTLIILLSLVVVIWVIAKAFQLYLFSDDVKNVASLTQELNAKKVMIVFAHPDDESYTTELLVNAETENIKTALLTFTPGDAGTQMPQVCQQQFLGDIRKAEVYKSGFQLGVDYQKVFDYGDGTLEKQNLQELQDKIVRELIQFQPDLVVTFWPESGMTMHPDHRTIGKATQLAFNQYLARQTKIAPRLAYTIMPPKVLSLLENEAMIKLQASANFSIKADPWVKTRLWEINASQQQFVKNYTGMPAWLLYRLLNREYYFVEGTK
ncbi:PIG-L family deacetylase [uncultured Draconibacterium sp.]|uniref:PIG-L deacetylase family protein n=1 Tax=uncultured Draconibacterium sp. TaxID=1573823 RepID=UPI0032174080